MKLDKATLIKNRFWIILGTAVFFTIIGWALLLLTVPGAVGKERGKVDKEWSNKKNPPAFKNPEWVKLQEKEAQELKAEQVKVQSYMYNAQAVEASVMVWPQNGFHR